MRDEAAALPTVTGLANVYWRDIRRNMANATPAAYAWASTFTFGARLSGKAHCTQRTVQMWRGWMRNLPAVAERLKRIKITGESAEDVAIPSGWNVFVDPPYPGTSDVGYDVGIKRDVLEALLLRLDGHDGQVLVMGWRDSYPELDALGWQRTTVDGGERTCSNNGYADGKPGKLMHLWAKDGFAQPELAL